MSKKRTVEYQRPVQARLMVHLDNDEDPWEATPEDFERFGLVDRHDAYMVFDDALTSILERAGMIEDGRLNTARLNTARLNAVRYLVETAIVMPELLNHPDHEGWAHVAEIERRLQASLPENWRDE